MPATSTLSLTKVGTPAKNPPRGSRRLLAGTVERGVRDGVELGIDPLRAGDRRLDHLGDGHLPGLDLADQPDRVELPEGVVSERMHPRHAAQATEK